MGNDLYAIDAGGKDRQRLNLVSEVLEATTLRLISEIGVSIGHRCLDLGCGGGNVTQAIARVVTEAGRVVGIDRDAKILEMAQLEAEQARLQNVEYQCIDVNRFVDDSYDFVYSRFLASHLSDSVEFIERMLSYARVGGKMAIEDIDISGCFTHPIDPAHRRFVELYKEVVGRMGGDGELGRRLPLMAVEAGWGDVK